MVVDTIYKYRSRIGKRMNFIKPPTVGSYPKLTVGQAQEERTTGGSAIGAFLGKHFGTIAGLVLSTVVPLYLRTLWIKSSKEQGDKAALEAAGSDPSDIETKDIEKKIAGQRKALKEKIKSGNALTNDEVSQLQSVIENLRKLVDKQQTRLNEALKEETNLLEIESPTDEDLQELETARTEAHAAHLKLSQTFGDVELFEEAADSLAEDALLESKKRHLSNLLDNARELAEKETTEVQQNTLASQITLISKASDDLGQFMNKWGVEDDEAQDLLQEAQEILSGD